VIVARVTNEYGLTFNVVLIRKGDRYGRNDCLTHVEDDPAVEFWDAKHENDPRFTLGLGQFVSSYCLRTLTGQDGGYSDDHRQTRSGIQLWGDVREWCVTGDNVIDALAAVEAIVGPIPPGRYTPPPPRRFNRDLDRERMTDADAADRVRRALASGWRASVSKGRHLSTSGLRRHHPDALLVRARKPQSSCGIGSVLAVQGGSREPAKVIGWVAFHPSYSKAPDGGVYGTRKAAAESLLVNLEDWAMEGAP